MFEFRFCKTHGLKHERKFSIKHYDNGWHRGFEIFVPARKDDLTYDVIIFQITYWNHFKTFFGKEKTNNDISEPGYEDNNCTKIV